VNPGEEKGRSAVGRIYIKKDNSCLQALTKDISTPADIAPSALETIVFYCFVGYISALTYYLLLLFPPPLSGLYSLPSLLTVGLLPLLSDPLVTSRPSPLPPLEVGPPHCGQVVWGST